MQMLVTTRDTTTTSLELSASTTPYKYSHMAITSTTVTAFSTTILTHVKMMTCMWQLLLWTMLMMGSPSCVDHHSTHTTTTTAVTTFTLSCQPRTIDSPPFHVDHHHRMHARQWRVLWWPWLLHLHPLMLTTTIICMHVRWWWWMDILCIHNVYLMICGNIVLR